MLGVHVVVIETTKRGYTKKRQHLREYMYYDYIKQ